MAKKVEYDENGQRIIDETDYFFPKGEDGKKDLPKHSGFDNPVRGTLNIPKGYVLKDGRIVKEEA